MSLELSKLVIDRSRCIRCASCSTLVPEVFVVERAGSRVIRQPASDAERRASEAAEANCPTGAITRSEA